MSGGLVILKIKPIFRHTLIKNENTQEHETRNTWAEKSLTKKTRFFYW